MNNMDITFEVKLKEDGFVESIGKGQKTTPQEAKSEKLETQGE